MNVTACNREKSFNLDTTTEVACTSHVHFLINVKTLQLTHDAFLSYYVIKTVAQKFKNGQVMQND